MWAKEHSYISDTASNIIMAARKSFIYDGKSLWVKQNNPNFDVTMGSWDGAEVCEIVGLYLLNKLVNIKQIFNKNEVGIFRDDGLSACEGNGHTLEQDPGSTAAHSLRWQN